MVPEELGTTPKGDFWVVNTGDVFVGKPNGAGFVSDVVAPPKEKPLEPSFF